jgi:hypothetical protein
VNIHCRKPHFVISAGNGWRIHEINCIFLFGCDIICLEEGPGAKPRKNKTGKAGRSPEGLALKSPRLKTRNSQTQEAGRSLENEISF